VVDRKSCWRAKTASIPEVVAELLCADCQSHYQTILFKEQRMSTGDRLVWGLLEKGKWPGLSSVRHSINGLKKLVLVEHRVSANTLKAVLQRWMTTLQVLTLPVYMCSTKVQNVQGTTLLMMYISYTCVNSFSSLAFVRTFVRP
jgi:hypothetical protein